VAGVPRGRGYAFAGSVGYADAAAAAAAEVVVQLVEGLPDVGSPEIPGRIVEVVAGGAWPPAEAPVVRDPIDRVIAERVAELVPEGAAVQVGLGAIPEAVLGALGAPVSVISGMVTDGVADLAARGLLRGQALAAYLHGSERLIELACAGDLRAVGVDELHDGARLARTPRFTAVNTAVQVGLDGAVNVERTGGRLVAGVGGHADYCAMASQADGGLSIVALRSTHRGRSTIVVRPEVVSTPRTDVHVVVTEHGVAHLRGATESQRRERLLAIADPQHVEELDAAARPV
jgi:acyl-CoA hydrolase